jgi:hypothetical protein
MPVLRRQHEGQLSEGGYCSAGPAIYLASQTTAYCSPITAAGSTAAITETANPSLTGCMQPGWGFHQSHQEDPERRHMIGDHHCQMADGTTLLLRARMGFSAPHSQIGRGGKTGPVGWCSLSDDHAVDQPDGSSQRTCESQRDHPRQPGGPMTTMDTVAGRGGQMDAQPSPLPPRFATFLPASRLTSPPAASRAVSPRSAPCCPTLIYWTCTATRQRCRPRPQAARPSWCSTAGRGAPTATSRSLPTQSTHCRP